MNLVKRVLLKVEFLSGSDVLQILVVCSYQEGLLGSFQPVPPHLQGEFDSSELSTYNVIVSLGWGMTPREKDTWVELPITGCLLGWVWN